MHELSWPRIRYDFNNLEILVTGGTGGIGAAIAAAFVIAGAQVTVTGTRPTLAAYEHAPEGVKYRQLQLGDREQLAQLAADFTRLDVLVNNAGGTGGAAEPYDFDTAIDVNLNAVYHLTQGLTDALGSSQLEGGASVVNVASEMSLFGSPYFPGYGAAKAAVVQLTKTFCAALAAQQIRVNAVLPGSIPTPMTAVFADDPAIHQTVSDSTPLARWGTPAEIAAAVLFLSSPAASFVSGHTLVVDGGYSVIK